MLAAMAEETWQLDSLDGSAEAPEQVALMVAPDGTFAGSTGCNAFQGRMEESNVGLAIVGFAISDRPCPELGSQDAIITNVLSTASSIELRDGRLLIRAGSGTWLAFVAER
jgi:heat shock protein HslJ